MVRIIYGKKGVILHRQRRTFRQRIKIWQDLKKESVADDCPYKDKFSKLKK